jgi:hypothetical protein
MGKIKPNSLLKFQASITDTGNYRMVLAYNKSGGFRAQFPLTLDQCKELFGESNKFFAWCSFDLYSNELNIERKLDPAEFPDW